jgi:hypothetical protein
MSTGELISGFIFVNYTIHLGRKKYIDFQFSFLKTAVVEILIDSNEKFKTRGPKHKISLYSTRSM